MTNLVSEKAEPRVYQQMIFSECVANSGNTLVVLPTGLGKTVIMAYLTAYKLQKERSKQVLILTPTRPLVHQIKEMFLEYIGNLTPDIVLELSGEVSPEKRTEMYQGVKIIVSTPQTIENDLTYNRLDIQNISLLCIDEAHRATGDYAYVGIAAQAKCQIVGFTATPGNNPEKILEVCENLRVSKISVTDEKDYDVGKYISTHTPKVVWIELPPIYNEILKDLQSFEDNLITLLKEKVSIPINTKYIGKREALAIHQQIVGLTKQDSVFGELLIVSANLIRVQHLKELVESQGFPQALNSIDKWRKKTSSKALRLFLEDERLIGVEDRLIENPLLHPKLNHLIKELKDVLDENKKNDSRIIIFSNYRDTVRFLFNELSKAGYDSAIFVGHSSTKEDKGLSQKEQVTVVEQFKNGDVQILLSTSVGEEGLDVGNCDLVVFYDSVPSVVRSIQRKGRGRKRRSRVIHLVTKGTRDEAMYWAIKRKQSQMKRFLKEELPQLLKRGVKSEPQKTLDQFFEQGEEPSEKSSQQTNQEFSPKIVIDIRETSHRLPKLLKKMGAILEPKDLEVGDYLLSDRILIEYKTYSDFIDSIIDGRLFKPSSSGQESQLVRLAQQKFGILLIEQEREEIPRQIHINSIMGAIGSILIDYKLSLVFTRNLRESATFVFQLAKREQEEKSSDYLLPSVTRKEQTIEDIQLLILAAIPGININKAHKLLEKFGSLLDIANATPDELSSVPSIGKKLAIRIQEVFGSTSKEKLT